MAVKEWYDDGMVRYALDLNFSLDEMFSYLSTDAVKYITVEVRDYLLKVIARRFQTKKGPMKRVWAKNSALTRKVKGHGKQLHYTGRLAKSVKAAVYLDEIVVSTDKQYAKFLQFGGTYNTTKKQSVFLWHNLFDRQGHPFASRRITVPSRPFFGFDTDNINDILKIMQKWYKKTEDMSNV